MNSPQHDLTTLMRQTAPFAVEQEKRTVFHLISTLFCMIVCVFLTTPVFSMAIRIAGSLLTGLILVRLFMFYHDHLHGAILQKSRWGKAIMWIYGIFLLNPPNIWKRSHNYHHRNNAQMATASIGSYPVMTVDQYKKASYWQRFFYCMSRHPLIFITAYIPVFLLGMCLGSFKEDQKRYWDSLLALVIHFILISSIWWFFGLEVVVLSFILPFFITMSVGAYLFYIQHNYPRVQMRKREDWNYLFAALHSSSFLKGGPILHWFTGNIGYHHIHHLNPLIPFYRLPEAMAAIPALQKKPDTSLSPGDIIRCLKLKLWDPEKKQMVGFP